jgi:hypothetical protein
MADPYALLGLTPAATAAEIKAAYHRELRRFPAHSHPQQFQQIRGGYEALRSAGDPRLDPLQPGPLRSQLDADAVAALDAQLRRSCRVELATLLRLTI